MEKCFEIWAVTKLTPKELTIFHNPKQYPHDHQDLIESLRDDWYGGAQADATDAVLSSLISKIPKQSPILNIPNS